MIPTEKLQMGVEPEKVQTRMFFYFCLSLLTVVLHVRNGMGTTTTSRSSKGLHWQERRTTTTSTTTAMPAPMTATAIGVTFS